MFQFRVTGMATMDQRTGTEREIREISSTILRSKRLLDMNYVAVGARTQEVNFSKITRQLDHIIKEEDQESVDTVDILLKRIF